MLHFSTKEQFDEAEPATLNGLDQPEQTTLPIPQLPQETQSALEHEPETHSLHLQPQHEETVLPTQSTLTADDMRRAKRIRVSGKQSASLLTAFLQPTSFLGAMFSSLFITHFQINPLILEESMNYFSVSLCAMAGMTGPRFFLFSSDIEAWFGQLLD